MCPPGDDVWDISSAAVARAGSGGLEELCGWQAALTPPVSCTVFPGESQVGEGWQGEVRGKG